jgi:cytoskeletal protein RodZ
MSTIIGQQLRRRREARSLSIEQAAAATRIRAHYLRSIEGGDLDLLPSAVHARGFLRAYADFLGMDAEPMLAEMEVERSTDLAPEIQAPEQQDEAPLSGTGEREEASRIFVDVGKQLQHQRELLGLSLEDVERHTHLRQHYLQALEAGDIPSLPSPVQGRGMLNNYAGFLGMDAEALLLRFAEGLQAQLEARRAANPEPRSEPIRENTRPPTILKRLVSPDFLIGGSIAIFLAVFVLWGIIRIFGMTSETLPTATAPSIAEILLATPTPSETPTQAPASPTPASQAALFPSPVVPTELLEDGTPPPESGGAAVQVYLTIRQRAWMRVTVDGELQFEGRVIPGSAYPFIGDSEVEVLTGNGAALQVFYNGADLGVMGDFGEVVDHIYTVQGPLTPTPTVTQTPTITPPVPTASTGTLPPPASSPTLPVVP